MDKFDLHTKIFIGGDAIRKMLAGMQRVFIVTDRFMHESGAVSYLTDQMGDHAQYQIFSEVTPDPDIDIVTEGVSNIL